LLVHWRLLIAAQEQEAQERGANSLFVVVRIGDIDAKTGDIPLTAGVHQALLAREQWLEVAQRSAQCDLGCGLPAAASEAGGRGPHLSVASEVGHVNERVRPGKR
jgi:hypothetical protein